MTTRKKTKEPTETKPPHKPIDNENIDDSNDGKSTIDRADFVALLAVNLGVSRTSANEVLSEVLTTFTDVFIKHDRLKLVGFGTFEKKLRSARMGRNPQTGEMMKIAPKKVISFKTGEKISDLIQ